MGAEKVRYMPKQQRRSFRSKMPRYVNTRGSGELPGLHMQGPATPYREKPGHHNNDAESAVVMEAKFPGTCGSCQSRFEKGEQIIYNTWNSATYHRKCPQAS